MNPAETACLGCIYIGPLARILGSDGAGGEYLSDNTAYVSFWVRHSRLADQLDRRLLQALMAWFTNGTEEPPPSRSKDVLLLSFFRHTSGNK